MTNHLSLCLIGKNEEHRLGTCLQSVAGLVDEVIIVDTGSTDRTREVALSHQARLFHFPWCDDFSAARNEALSHATGDWIFWLDADEFLDEINRQKMQSLKAALGRELAAYVMTQRSLPAAGSGASRILQIRLFRNHPLVHWEYRVHEQLLPALRRAGHEIRGSDIVITHTGYQDPTLRDGKLERNLDLLHLDLAERPEDPFVLFNLGVVYSGLGQPAKALDFLRRSLEVSNPGDSIRPKLYGYLVRSHNQLGQPREALALCRAGLGDFPQDPDLLFLNGLVQRTLGNPSGAENSWEQILLRETQRLENGLLPREKHKCETSADHPLASQERDEGLAAFTRYQLAILYRDQGKLSEAEKLWRANLAEQPDLAVTWQGLGELFLTRGCWEELDKEIAHLARFPTGMLEGEMLRARAFLARKEYGPARILLEGIIAQNPQQVPPRAFLTHVLLQEGRDLAAAEQALGALLTLDPTQGEAWRNLAVLLARQGRLDAALEACQSGQAKGIEDPDLALLHGILLYEAGDLTRAEANLTALLGGKKAPVPVPFSGLTGLAKEQRGKARHYLALVFRRQKRLAEAEKEWQGALEDLPESPPVLQGLTEVFLAQGRLGEMERVLARLEAGPEGVLAGKLLRVRLHLARKEYLPARELLEKLIAREPQSPQAFRLLSYVLLQEGTDLGAAEKVLRQLITLAPGDAEARHNLALLLNKQGRQPPPNPFF